MHHSADCPWERILAVFLALLVLTWGGCIPATPLKPFSGLTRLEELASVDVPGGLVNTRGGNLILSRSDISLDTPLGTQEIRATYNSASGRWLWNFQMTYDGERFIDPSGAVFDHISRNGILSSGGTIFGTFWVRVDENTMKTKGGRAYHFGPDGSLSYMSWATMDYPRIEFSPSQISQCTQATTCTPLFNLMLNANGNPLRITDARTGRVAEFTYDTLGRLSTATSPLDVADGRPGFRYEYSILGTLLTAVTNAEGERVEYEYQADRRILHVTQIGEGDPRHRFEFYGQFLERWITVHTNPLGGVTRYQFDRFKRLRELSWPSAGDVREYRYGTGELSAFARPTTIIGPSGARTTYTYSTEDDVIEIVEPSGNVITYTYNFDAIDPQYPFFRPTARVEDSIGLIVAESHDAQGRPQQIELPEGNTITSAYSTSTLSSLTLPLGDPLTFDIYGAHGHWTDASLPGSSFPIRRAFDQVGNLLVPAAGLQEGGVLDRSFNPNRKIEEIHVAATAAGQVTSEDYVSISRRNDGRVSYVSRPHGADHEYVYDTIGRPVILREKVDGTWNDTAFEYDLAGNLTARERPNAMREEFSFDEYSRLIGKAARQDGVLEGEVAITWENGLPKTFFDSKRGITETYIYDAGDRLARILYSSGESLAFSHDLRSRMASQSFVMPGGQTRTVEIDYDGANRPTVYTLDGGEVLAEFFYENMKQVRTEYGNGLTRFAQYDPNSAQLLGFTTEDQDGLVIEDTVVTRGVATGSQRYRVSSVTTTPLATTTENYDFGLAGVLSDIDKRVGNRVWGWNDGSGSAKQYVYDELSNLQSNSAGDSFAYNPEENRLLSATLAHEGAAHIYVYDDAGFVIERDGIPITWTATGKIASYGPVYVEWDMVNRPISVTAGPLTYDFALFGGLVASDPVTGAVGDLDLGFVSIPFSGDARLFRHRDFRSNISFTSDEAGTVVSHYRYTAYGVDAIFGAGSNARRFAGAHEIGDGLFLMGWRVYDSHVARFLSPDPLLQDLNQFAYTLGNPVDFTDASGLRQASQGDLGEAKQELAVDLMGALLTMAVATYAVLTGVTLGAALLAGAAFSLAGWQVAEAIEDYQAAKKKAEGGRETGGAPAKPPVVILEDVQTTSNGGAGGATGNVGGGALSFPVTTVNRFGLTGFESAPGCGDGAPDELARVNLRSHWYPVAAVLWLQFLGAVIVLRRRGFKREG